MRLIHALLSVVTMAASPSVAAAAVPQSIKVETGDLDLGSIKGRRILTTRIQRAARTMCKSQALESLPHNIRHEHSCIRQAQASAEAAAKTLTAASDPISGRGG